LNLIILQTEKELNNPEPTAHKGGAGHEGHAEHFCRFNNAFKVNKGSFGPTALDGAKFWVAGDLGGDFSKGQMDWAELTFDPSVTKAQRDGIAQILGSLYPVKWQSFKIAADQPMDWTATKDHAEAKLAGGKTAEVVSPEVGPGLQISRSLTRSTVRGNLGHFFPFRGAFQLLLVDSSALC
jgi:hypothetical protein